LPPRADGLEIAFEYEPVMRVGGDLLDIISLPENRMLFFVGDSVGHGVPAALVMCAAATALRSAVAADPYPPQVLASVNRAISGLFDGRFVTAACCVVDPDQEIVELALAGHPGPIRYDAQSGVVCTDCRAGLPLGVERDTEYPVCRLDLAPGDSLIFCTDGVLEAADPAGHHYGYGRLKDETLRYGHSSAADLLARIKGSLEAHRNGTLLEDDLTLLVVRAAEVYPPKQRDREAISAPVARANPRGG
jgi:serine phosphatase RsbU (regulator of sigma subunit)